MNIKVEQHYRDAWIAYDDDSYDGPGSALGHGKSREEAIDDLLEKMVDGALSEVQRPQVNPD